MVLFCDSQWLGTVDKLGMVYIITRCRYDCDRCEDNNNAEIMCHHKCNCGGLIMITKLFKLYVSIKAVRVEHHVSHFSSQEITSRIGRAAYVNLHIMECPNNFCNEI